MKFYSYPKHVLYGNGNSLNISYYKFTDQKKYISYQIYKCTSLATGSSKIFQTIPCKKVATALKLAQTTKHYQQFKKCTLDKTDFSNYSTCTFNSQGK